MRLNKLIKNLNKATAVAAAIGMAICLFPAIAQAQVIRFFNFSGNAFPGDTDPFTDNLTFSVGTSEIPVSDSDVVFGSTLGLGVQDVNILDSQGVFPGAIRDFTVRTNDDNLNLSFPSGTLRTSRLTIDPTTGNFPGLGFGYQAITDNNFSYAAFNNDGLRYDFTFDNRSETLTLFIPSNDSNLINSLSGLLSSFPGSLPSGGVQGVVKYPSLGIEQRLLVTGAQRITVPEPTATSTLLGVGALGAVSLLKRNKRFSKPI